MPRNPHRPPTRQSVCCIINPSTHSRSGARASASPPPAERDAERPWTSLGSQAAGVPLLQDVGGQDRPFADEALARVEYRPALSAPLQRVAGPRAAVAGKACGWLSRALRGDARSYLAPNLTELERLTGMKTAGRPDVIAAAKTLTARGAKNVLVTMGEDGALLVRADGSVHPQPPPRAACTPRRPTRNGSSVSVSVAPRW